MTTPVPEVPTVRRFIDDDFPVGMVDEIDRYLADDAFRSPGQDLYPSVFETGMFFPLQRQRELVRMMRTARRIQPKVVMEIGADKGGGLYHWIKCLTSVKRVIACEIRGTPYAQSFERAFPNIDFLWLQQSSYTPDTVQQVRTWLRDDCIDCCFIDGDKSAFLEDFEQYLSVMRRPGGIMFMHDIQDNAPRDAFLTVKYRGFKCEEVIDIGDSSAAYERERKGEPSANAHESWLRFWRGKSCGVGIIYL